MNYYSGRLKKEIMKICNINSVLSGVHFEYYAAFLWLMVFIMLGVWHYQALPSLPQFVENRSLTPVSKLSSTTQPLLIQSILPNTAPSVHSATLAQIGQGQNRRLMAAWFGGSREGAKDVKIYASFLDLPDLESAKASAASKSFWSDPKVIVSPRSLEAQSGTYIKKLGNPVLYQTPDGVVHLFVVATSYAGWAAAKIYHLTSKNGDDFVFR